VTLVAETVGGALESSAPPRAATGLERLRLAHRALPGRARGDVRLRTRLLGADLEAPVLLEGATREAAAAASEHGTGLLLAGDVLAPDRPPLLLAAVGLQELRAVDGPERAERQVARLDADGLVVRLDLLAQVSAGGPEPPRWPIEAIAAAAARIAPLPLVVRADGCGLDAADARELRLAGASAIDVGGGEAHPGDPHWETWGVPLADAVAEAALGAGGVPVLAGGLRDGVEVAKCLALGAAAAAVAVAPERLGALIADLRVAVWATGAAAAAELNQGYLRAAP